MAIDKIRSRDFTNAIKNRGIDVSVGKIDSHHSTAFNPDTIGVKEIVGRLGFEHKEIIDLMYFKGLTQNEIAERLNIPLGTVKTRSRTAIMKLRNYFNMAG